MKALRIIAVFAVAACLLSPASAHPASKVELSFDTGTQLLSVDFNHKVKDAQEHFIYQVQVEINKVTIIEQSLKSQDDTSRGSLIYRIIDAKPGDEIKVITRCNKSGNKAAKLTIEAPSGD